MPRDSPVKFVFRADVSWNMEQQSKELAGIVNMWICGDGILSWYPEVARSMKQRGDIVWFYSGPPPVTEVSAKVTEFPLQAASQRALNGGNGRRTADGQRGTGVTGLVLFRRH